MGRDVLKDVVKAANSFKKSPSAPFLAKHKMHHYDEKRWEHTTSFLRIKGLPKKSERK